MSYSPGRARPCSSATGPPGPAREHRSRAASLVRAFRDPVGRSCRRRLLFIIVFLCFAGPWVFHLPNPNVGNFKD